MQTMQKRIQELNSLVQYSNIKMTHGVAKFILPQTFKIIFYKNGIFLKNGPLRLYSMPECKIFIRDILDGYFPTELQKTYPNGVIFEIFDQSNQICSTNQVCHHFLFFSFFVFFVCVC